MKFLLRLYKSTISILLVYLFGKGCRYNPTCSEYTVSAIDKYGLLKGSFLGVKRVLSCHP